MVFNAKKILIEESCRTSLIQKQVFLITMHRTGHNNKINHPPTEDLNALMYRYPKIN